MGEEFVPCSNCRGMAPKSRMKFRKRSQPFQFVCCGHCFDLWGSERRHEHGKNCFLNKNSYYGLNPEYNPTYNPAVRERTPINYEETTTDCDLEDESEPRGRKRSRIGSRITPKREASNSRGEKREKQTTSVGRKEKRSRSRGPRSSNKRNRSRFRE